ncbi:reverse transcriptase domain-containing protein [Tanacetum coccineum]
MAISVILVSSNSSEESVGTSIGRVILFGTIPTTIPDTTPSVIPPTTHIDTTLISTVSPTIPPSPDYTPASLDYTPASPDYTPTSPNYSLASDTESDPSKDPSSDHIPPLPATSPFLSSTDDSLDSDIPDTPPSPTHGTPFTETTISTQSSPVASGELGRRVIILALGQPIPHGRTYRYHLNGPVHMMTTRKRVGPLPTPRLAVRHSVDYSSSDHFASDDSLSSSSSSSLKTSPNHSSNDLSDSLYNHSLPAPSSGIRPNHHLCSLVSSIPRLSAAISNRPSHDSSSASPSRKRSRSPAASVPLSSPVPGALSYACANLLPSPKRIRSLEPATDLEVRWAEGSEPSRYRGTDLEMDDDVVRSDGIDIDPEIQVEIDERIAYADALRVRGIDARVVVEAVDREEIESSARGSVEVRVDRVTHPVISDDTPEPA